MGDEERRVRREGAERDPEPAGGPDLWTTAHGEAFAGEPPDEETVAELGEEIVRRARHLRALERRRRELEAEYERLSGGETPPHRAVRGDASSQINLNGRSR